MSTARFMGLWALSGALLHLAWGLISGWILQNALYRQDWALMMNLTYVLQGAVAIVLGFIQSALLKRHRARVRFWPLALLLGSVAATYLAVSVGTQIWDLFNNPGDQRLNQWIQMIVWGATRGLCLGATLGLAVWGRRWTPAWTVWLPGFVILETSLSLLYQGLGMASSPGSAVGALGMAALSGGTEAAGMAWLLDRLVFKPSGKLA